MCGRAVEKLFLFHGRGRNGKGLLNKLMAYALSNYAMKGDIKILTNEKTMGACPEIANMDRKRYIYFQEPSKRKRLNNQIVKDLTGGEAKARLLYSNEDKVRLNCSVCMECNDRPLFQEPPTTAEYDRVVDILFTSHFEEDKRLVDKEQKKFEINVEYTNINMHL